MSTATEVREKPILFSGEMVRAILDGRKTQTRRVIKPQPSCTRVERWYGDNRFYPVHNESGIPDKALVELAPITCPYGAPGEELWVRETFHDGDGHGHLIYRATADEAHQRSVDKWRPSIFMPRWASRIQLEVTGVRVERVQEITPEDARAEGVTINHPDSMAYGNPGLWVERFRELWDSINADRGYGWDTNCWVWVISFRRIKP